MNYHYTVNTLFFMGTNFSVIVGIYKELECSRKFHFPKCLDAEFVKTSKSKIHNNVIFLNPQRNGTL